MRKHASR